MPRPLFSLGRFCLHHMIAEILVICNTPKDGKVDEAEHQNDVEANRKTKQSVQRCRPFSRRRLVETVAGKVVHGQAISSQNLSLLVE